MTHDAFLQNTNHSVHAHIHTSQGRIIDTRVRIWQAGLSRATLSSQHVHICQVRIWKASLAKHSSATLSPQKDKRDIRLSCATHSSQNDKRDLYSFQKSQRSRQKRPIFRLRATLEAQHESHDLLRESLLTKGQNTLILLLRATLAVQLTEPPSLFRNSLITKGQTRLTLLLHATLAVQLRESRALLRNSCNSKMTKETYIPSQRVKHPNKRAL